MLKPESYVGSLVLRRYRLDHVISTGGMGVLYGATHLRTERKVAIKFLLDGDDNGRFVLEARAAAQLKHPNVVDVIDMDEDEDGVPFLVLELLEGHSLAGVLEGQPRLPAEQLLGWMLPVIGALAVAHDRGILHRDLKPGNIFIAHAPGGRTVPKLLDFGVAKDQSQPTLTRSGSVVGTPSYMSPEQARGDRDLLAASDVWGMGVILFRCLTGRLPFEHETVIGTLMRIVNERAARVESIAADVPRALGWAVDRALQHDPAVRYPDMRSLARALMAAALRDNIRLPESPDPLGLADWPSWLASESATASTGAVPVTPSSSPAVAHSQQVPPAVEFAATQVGLAQAPAAESIVRTRPGRVPLLLALLAAFAIGAGLLAFMSASNDTATVEVLSPMPAPVVEPAPAPSAEPRLTPESEVAATTQVPTAEPPAAREPAPPGAAPTVDEPVEAAPSDKTVPKSTATVARPRPEHRKPREANVRGSTPSPAPPKAQPVQDGLSIETNWR